MEIGVQPTMPKRIKAELCVRCKGWKRLCGAPSCPIVDRFRVHMKVAPLVAEDEAEGSSPPTVVVGESGYPYVRVYWGVGVEKRGDEAKILDDPPRWWGRYSIRDIIELRSSILSARIRQRFNVNDAWRLYELELSCAAASEKPVDSEVKLSSKPKPRLTFDGYIAPIGPTAIAEQVKVTSNARLPRPVERIITDDLPAREAIAELYDKGVDYYTIIRALSLGLLGKLKQRKLVPTRWAITAVDSTVSKFLKRRIMNLKSINSFEVHRISYLGNRFTVILTPSPYFFYLAEVWYPKATWMLDSKNPVIIENFELGMMRPRDPSDGGYYAAEVGVLEYLVRRGRCAGVIVIREITPEYYVSVGNWHIRESLKRLSDETLIAKSNDIAPVEEVLRNLLGDNCSVPINLLKQRRIIDYS